VENPFRPTAGATPPDLIGRGGVLDEFAYGLRIGSGAPGLLTIFTGARGIGKTVMLGAAAASRNDLAIRVAVEFVVRSVVGTKPLILSQEGNRLARTLTEYQPKAPRTPRMTIETTQNRAESFGREFSYITTNPTFNRYTSERILPEAPCKKLESRRSPVVTRWLVGFLLLLQRCIGCRRRLFIGPEQARHHYPLASAERNPEQHHSQQRLNHGNMHQTQETYSLQPQRGKSRRRAKIPRNAPAASDLPIRQVLRRTGLFASTATPAL
jgi:hypothetical protein